MLHLTFRIISLLLLTASASVHCVAQQQHADIHAFIDNWHSAASNAKADDFFGAMASDCIYIGTDKTESWAKAEFITFAKPYFDKGKAWDFKPYDRDLHVTSDGKSAWFSELLTTWMGVCRGSGVIEKVDGSWQLKQYHLSVTVPNDLIRDFITLVENFERKVKP
jgi:ketosteroid isomerase-like protein